MSGCGNGSPIITDGKLTTPPKRSFTERVDLYTFTYSLLNSVNFLDSQNVSANELVSR